MSGLEERIEKAAAARQAEWARGEEANPVRVQELSSELQGLYAAQRSGRMARAHGSRIQIVKRARTELELERLAPKEDESQNESSA